MRYHYNEPDFVIPMYGETYTCNHPVYDRCTLFEMNGIGLAIIQQRQKDKTTWWAEIDANLANDIYLHPGFIEYFRNRAGKCVDGLYPTVTVRQIMWALRMKPIPRERWETCFNRRDI